jgi:hypothetical protein
MPLAVRIVAVAAVCLGCATRPAAAQAPPVYHAADSIALERIWCFDGCGGYRVSVARTGEVHFISRSRGDSGRIVRAHIDPLRFQGLTDDALFAAFLSLPDTIGRNSTFCFRHFTDSPTAIVSLFLPTRSKRVVDDHGCVWTPGTLRDLEDAIDNVAGTKQWAHPAPS